MLSTRTGTEDFGVIIVCCEQDYWSAKACCASVRHFLGDVPICLLIDGEFSVSSLKKAYDLKVLDRTNVSNEFLKKRSFGYGITKMIAFWESPYKHFLLLDADTIVWGDIRKHINFNAHDITIDKDEKEYSEEDINKWFFDTEKIQAHFPDYRWQNRPYVCTGVILGTRGVFNIELYKKILKLTQNETDMFFFGEMGFLNFMMFSEADKGSLRLGHADMQVIVSDFPEQYLRERFPVERGKPTVRGEEACVIHYAGVKALISERRVYSEPMLAFRLAAVKEIFGFKGLAGKFLLRGEEFLLHRPRVKRLVHSWTL